MDSLLPSQHSLMEQEQDPSASPPAQPQTSITSTYLFIELQLRDSLINLIHAIVFKEQKSWKEKQKRKSEKLVSLR